ncbi:ABC transporter related [Methanococcus aeolicus Nankai-3]|uniref:ABC transporter related n=1 Tax=Methanococcus aeolicus (strain ATCC BAA-1280 / DSM 17508 / OCM 812 / Nankai-3) TaxID=419665 RepID=A6UVB8_META3|nr:ATP-binding cassette domain-containing protein [Methanococcus aeolicus]ABR56440.1 ABC transporter related [Methanococcus aeolicus Nankai-3]
MTVKVNNLSKYYGKKKVLDNISFEAKKGEIVGIIGKSGAGKSTIIKILRGTDKEYEGEIEICGKKENLREITAIHIQRNFALWAEPAIYNIIRKLYAIRTNSYNEELPMEEEWEEYEKTATEILKLVGLEHKKNAYSNILSGGEKQRLIMGRQIAKIYEKGEGVLLLDEPATMSCPASKQALLEVLKNINDKLNITIIITSHLPEIHEYLCDRCILLENGRVKMEGAPNQIINEFLKDMPEPEQNMGAPKDNNEIEVNNISKRYFVVNGGETLNLKDISFSVKEQEILSIIGPSGTGKSVLLRLLAGLEVPDNGTITIDGVDLTDYGWERVQLRRKIGIMHQEFSLTHYLTVEQLLKYRQGIKGEGAISNAKLKSAELNISPKTVDAIYQLIDLPEAEMKNKLEKLGISEDIVKLLFPAVVDDFHPKEVLSALDLDEEILKKTPMELSGGERVRVALALQIISKPKILLLDEPFGDLDPITLREVSNYLKKINNKFGTTIVVISHHIELIKEISHRAILIDENKLIGDGAPEKICNEFIERSCSKFLGQ